MDMDAMAAEVAWQREERLAAHREVLERLRAIPPAVLAEWLVLSHPGLVTPADLADLEERAAWAEEERAYAAWKDASAALQQARAAVGSAQLGKAYYTALAALGKAEQREKRAWRKYYRLSERHAARRGG